MEKRKKSGMPKKKRKKMMTEKEEKKVGWRKDGKSGAQSQRNKERRDVSRGTADRQRRIRKRKNGLKALLMDENQSTGHPIRHLTAHK